MWMGTFLLGAWFMAERGVHPGAASPRWVPKWLGVHVLPWVGSGPSCPCGHHSPKWPPPAVTWLGIGAPPRTPRAPALPGAPVHEGPLAVPPHPKEAARSPLELPRKLQQVGLVPR